MPDPYAGRIGDPMSAKSYTWNNNNPVAYSDPTGYESACVSLNQACLSPQATTEIGNKLAWLFDTLFGKDIRTVSDSHASTGARVAANAFLALNFVGGEVTLPLKVIGRMAELEHVARGLTLLDKLTPDLGSPLENGLRNIQVIKDAAASNTAFFRCHLCEIRHDGLTGHNRIVS